jgi:predicted ATP-dependent serine protease
MDCISVNEYVCKMCGYVIRSKPSCFPLCPACQIGETKYESNTKENQTHDRQRQASEGGVRWKVRI